MNMAYTFVLSDDSVLSNGYYINLKGLDLSRFVQNPVMLYNHNRNNGIIGRWENLRFVGSQLLAEAVFDESTKLGAMVKKRVDEGFLSACSICVNDTDIEGNKIKTSTLVEVSIVDLPGNKNSTKQNNSGDPNCLYFSIEQQDPTDDNLKSSLCKLLNIDESTSDDDIITLISDIINKGKEDKVEKAFRNGYIKENQIVAFKAMIKYDPNTFDAYISEKEVEQKNDISKIIDDAIDDGKIIYSDRAVFAELGNEVGAKVLRKVFKRMHNAIKITDFVAGGKDADRRTWGLNEYRKYAPEELKNNPLLYNKLCAQEKTEQVHDLDWYRKNNPEYLEKHPSVYKRLVREEVEY